MLKKEKIVKFTNYCHNRFIKFISLTLVLTVLFTSIPFGGIIASAEQTAEENEIIAVVEELEQYRTEFSKTYLKSDGTLESVVSANAIHFKDGNKWAEIDSTLETAKNENGQEVLKNKKGTFNVELPTEIESGSEISIEKAEHKISIKLLETEKSKGKKNNDKKQKAEKLTKTQRKNMTAGELFEVDNNQTSAVEYSAVYNDTDIRYDVTPNEVKESIVLTKAPNKKAAYSYEITADGLTAVLNEDNSIDFYKKGAGNNSSPVFSMPAPHMFDSNDEYSYNIETTLENKNGKFILTYKPNYEWLKSKERSYPVTIDPTVTVNSGIQDSYTFSGEGYGDSYTGYEQQLKVGTTAWINPNDYWQTYLKFTDLPQIPYEDYRIDSAYLTLSPKATTGSWEEMELGVYELTEDWKTHQTGKVAERITFNNAPADVGYSTATATVSRGNADIGVDIGFEICHLVEKWYDSPETNFGIKLAAHLEQNQYNDNLVFHSSRSTTGTAPYLTLTYSEYVPVTDVEIIGKQERLEYRLSVNAFEVTANIYPENATNKDIIWESSNESAAYYDDGYIWAAGVGTTTITAKSADNNEIFDSFALEVYNIPIETINITNLPENNALGIGDTHQLSFEAGPDDATDKSFIESVGVEWYSSDYDVVSVNRYSGMLTAQSCGTAVITATYGNLTDSVTITVKDAICDEIEFIFISDDSITLFEHEQYSISAIALYQNNVVNAGISYCSNNAGVVSVSENGYLTANSVGTAVITVSATDTPTVFRNLTVTVLPIQSAKIVNLPENNLLNFYNKEHRLDLEITAKNSTATESDPIFGDRFAEFFEWNSSNSNIATVDAEGYIWPHAAGTTVITVSKPNGGEVLDSFTLTVIDVFIPINYVNTVLPIGTMFVGTTDYLYLQLEPSNATDKRAVATSSDESVISVEVRQDKNNLSAMPDIVLTAHKEGRATITVTFLSDTTQTLTETVDVISSDFGLNLPYENTIYTGQTWDLSTNPQARTDPRNDGIISVDEYGNITGVGPGTTSVEVWLGERSYFAHVEITVIQSYDLAITGLPDTIYAGQTIEGIGVIGLPDIEGTLSWSVLDENIASVVDNGFYGVEITGVSKGTTTVYAEFIGDNTRGFASFNLTVDELKITNIDLETSAELDDNIIYLGDQSVIKAKISPQIPIEPPFESIDWKTSNDQILSLRSINKYRAEVVEVRPGTVNVWAQIGDVSSKPFPITVKKPWATITNKPSTALYKGQTHTLGYTTDPQNAEIKWDSSNDSVAVINSQTGEIAARASGEVMISITVKYGDFIEITDTFTLEVKNQWIWVDGYDSTELIIGDTVNLIAEVGTYANDDKTVIWQTSNSNIATVNNGVVTAVGVGEVTITASLKKYPSVSWPVTFTVNLPSATNIKIINLPTNKTLYIGQTHQLGYTIIPSNIICDIEWYSSDAAIAEIDKQNGKITAKATGNVTITVKATYKEVIEYTNSFSLDVKGANVFINSSKDILTVGETISLTAEVFAGGTASQEVEWKSDDTSVATVDQNGVVTAITSGEVIISVKSKQYNYAINTITFEVEPLLIYQTKDIPGYKYNENTGKYDEAEDMCINDVDLSQITITASELTNHWRYLCTTVTTEPLQTVGLNMIDHFIEGSGAEYKNEELTKAALSHESTITYLNIVKEKLSYEISNTHDIKTLFYNVKDRENSIMVNALTGHYQPVFNTNSDIKNGLTFCIDSLWGHKMELVSYEIKNNKYTANVKITFYDHFGLDSEDIDKYGYLSGFRAWYTLQHAKHFNGRYKPFVTLIETEMQISDFIN